jgi:hypothetical protein
MSCRQAYQRKDNSDGKGTEDTKAYRDSDGYRRSGSVLEWRNHLDDSLWVSDRGSGHYRPSTYTYELCRSCTADSQTVRSWRLLLLAGEQSSVCSIFIPDAERLSQIFSQAIAPTFFLGAVAAFVSLMASRLSAVMARLQTLNAITEDDHPRVPLKSDVERLRRRSPVEQRYPCIFVRWHLCHRASRHFIRNRILRAKIRPWRWLAVRDFYVPSRFCATSLRLSEADEYQ